MPSRCKATTTYAAYTLSTLSLIASVTSAHAHAHAHGAARLERGLGAIAEKRATMSYSGCYSSSAGLQDQGSYQYQTSSYCQPICVGQNQAVFGLSGGSDCWCGNTLPPTSSKVADSNCNTPCNGYGSDDCGGTGFYSIYLTGLQQNVPNADGSVSSSSSASSSSGASSISSVAAASSSSAGASTSSGSGSAVTAAPSVTTTSINGKTTVVITEPADRSTGTAPPPPSAAKHSSANVGGIAAGVVVGVVAVAAIIGGIYFFIRHKKKQEEVTEYKKTQVSDFMKGGDGIRPPPTAYSQMSDSRLDPEAGARRNSSGSIADDQDYSRRILRVANPDNS